MAHQQEKGAKGYVMHRMPQKIATLAHGVAALLYQAHPITQGMQAGGGGGFISLASVNNSTRARSRVPPSDTAWDKATTLIIPISACHYSELQKCSCNFNRNVIFYHAKSLMFYNVRRNIINIHNNVVWDRQYSTECCRHSVRIWGM